MKPPSQFSISTQIQNEVEVWLEGRSSSSPSANWGQLTDALTASEADQVELPLEVLAHHAQLLLGQSSLSVIGGVINHTVCVERDR